MTKNSLAIKTLVLIGTVSIWIPFLFMSITSIMVSIIEKELQVDFLLPLELGVFTIIGAVITLYVSHRLNYRLKEVIICLSAMIFFLVLILIMPIITGIATGHNTNEVWIYVMLGLIGLYFAVSIYIGIIAINVLKYVLNNSSKHKTN